MPPVDSPLHMPIFDADNHYYEALDAFTRHLDPALGPRVIQWAEIGGRRYHVLGGRVSRAVSNPTFDPVAPAGTLVDYFRGNPQGRPMHELMGTPGPIRPEYRDREARLEVMDAQGLQRIWMFPTLGMLYEEALKHDPGAVVLLFRAFNRWLAEDWGMAYRDRIFAAPYITLADVDEAVRELEWALGQGARSVVLRAAAPTTADGPLSPAADLFDPFWARVNEAGITVVVHAGDAGLSLNGYAPEGFAASFRGGPMRLEHQAVRHRAGGPRLPGHAHPRTAVRAVPQCARGVRGKRLRLPGAALPEAACHGAAHARLFHRGPGRDVPAPRVDQSVLGGRRRRDRGAHGRRSRHLRFRLAARGRSARAHRLDHRAPEAPR